MNLLQLILKQMRQRSLSTVLTILSVILGVALAIAIMLFQREGKQLFGQSEYGYDLILGAKGSRLQLVLNTTYHLSASPGNIPYQLYTSLPERFPGRVQWALPMGVGDNYRGHRIIGTTPNVFPVDHAGQAIDPAQVFEYRLGHKFHIAGGRAFRPATFEAVIGSEVAEKTGLRLGDKFRPTHGLTADEIRKDEHEEQWTVVGILTPTHTANDRIILIPLESFYAIPAHEEALRSIAALEHHEEHDAEHHEEHAEHHHHDEAYHLEADGTIHLHIPPEQWKLSAILVRTNTGADNGVIAWEINNGPQAMAVQPATEMREFFDTFLAGSSRLLLLVSVLVTVVAAVSILVSIYNSVTARLGEIAILRALGATRRRVLSLLVIEAGIVGLVGSVVGLVVGHLLAAGSSLYLRRLMGEGIRWTTVGSAEWLYLLLVVALACLAGLVPALKAYRTPVATHLV